MGTALLSRTGVSAGQTHVTPSVIPPEVNTSAVQSQPVLVQDQTTRRCEPTPPAFDRIASSRADYSKVTRRFLQSKQPAAPAKSSAEPRFVSLLAGSQDGCSVGGVMSVYGTLIPPMDPQGGGSCSLSLSVADHDAVLEMDPDPQQRVLNRTGTFPHVGLTARDIAVFRNSRQSMRPLYWVPEKKVDATGMASISVQLQQASGSNSDWPELQAAEGRSSLPEQQRGKKFWPGSSGTGSSVAEVLERKSAGSLQRLMQPSGPDLSIPKGYATSPWAGLPQVRLGRHLAPSLASGLAVSAATAKRASATGLGPLSIKTTHTAHAKELRIFLAPKQGVESESKQIMVKQDNPVWGNDEDSEPGDIYDDEWGMPRSSDCSRLRHLDRSSLPDISQAVKLLTLKRDFAPSTTTIGTDWTHPYTQSTLLENMPLMTGQYSKFHGASKTSGYERFSPAPSSSHLTPLNRNQHTGSYQ